MATMPSSLRMGAVSYLNARPLTWALDNDPHWQVRYDLPSVCAEVLARGDSSVGIGGVVMSMGIPGRPGP